MFILGLLHILRFGGCVLIPCRGCLKRASAAAVQCRAAPQGLSVLVRASAVDHGGSLPVLRAAMGRRSRFGLVDVFFGWGPNGRGKLFVRVSSRGLAPAEQSLHREARLRMNGGCSPRVEAPRSPESRPS